MIVLNMFIRASWLATAICAGGVVLFSLYLIMDVQASQQGLSRCPTVPNHGPPCAAVVSTLPVRERGLVTDACAVPRACGLAVLAAPLLAVSAQWLMGSHKAAISPDEYVFATLNLYLDIINIFLYILQLLGNNSNN